jgi:hypothetical protein
LTVFNPPCGGDGASGSLNIGFSARKRLEAIQIQKGKTMFHCFEGEDDRRLNTWLKQNTVESPTAQVAIGDLRSAFNESLNADGYPSMTEEEFECVMLRNRPGMPKERQGLCKQLVYLGISLRTETQQPGEELTEERIAAIAKIVMQRDARLNDLVAAFEAFDLVGVLRLAGEIAQLHQQARKK